MFNERSALEKLFNSLDDARERRYQQYLDEMTRIESQQLQLLEDLRRVDEESHIHSEIIEQKKEERAVTAETKKHLAMMNDQPNTKDKVIAEKFGFKVDELEQISEQDRKIPVVEQKPKEPMVKIGKPIIKDGTKTWPDGTITYQAYYICPSCGDRAKRFLATNHLETYCFGCNKKMKVQHATSKGFPHQDMYGNYFVAGDFIRVEDRNQETFQDKMLATNPVDAVLAKYEQEQALKETAVAAAFKESAKLSPGF